MNTIEQAAKRIEQLRRAGIDVPWGAAGVEQQTGQPPAADAGTADTKLSVAPVVTDAQSAHLAPDGEDGRGERRSKQVDLNLHRLGETGYLIPGRERSQLEEEFRIIKRPLLKNATGQSAAPVNRANLIMVTSALPGEGKTYTSINLAISLAMELDHTVLLVDADVVRPSVLDRLGLPASPGLLDILTQPDLDLADVMLKTNIPKLTLLPAGSAAGVVNTTELLASGAMEALLTDLAQTYSDRIIVFDAPPLLPSTESRVLATHMGQIVVVVEADRTPKTSVAQAFNTLEACPVVMSVLNKCSSKKANSAYGYYAV
ncbi:MAG: XrtA-associated tyrosine autokinase [Burkholderiales bacterium]|nr:XrtA-associated tyrosine autokinase [Burkholderiales bacterium]MDE2433106.1 XrtA-associated tyrosine autokinase [Burkholderiales bacterium]